MLNHHTEFLTSTIYSWYHLLKEDSYKHVILESLDWLVKEKKCTLNAFVIMPNHIYMILYDLENQMDLNVKMFRELYSVLLLTSLKKLKEK
jgi:REP element-mobilizing transposase RayT